MKFNYIYGKQAEQYDYLYIPKAFMKEEPFKTMTASAKIMYAVLMEKQQKSVEMGWIDEKDHAYILATNPILSINLTPEETIDEIEGYSEIIKENIDYDSLLLAHSYDQEMVEGIFNLILETVLSKNEEITIAGDVYPKNLVKSKFLNFQLDEIKKIAKNYISDLMVLTTKEKEYLDRFEEKKYMPELLFENAEIVERVKNHPMALWKCKE